MDQDFLTKRLKAESDRIIDKQKITETVRENF